MKKSDSYVSYTFDHRNALNEKINFNDHAWYQRHGDPSNEPHILVNVHYNATDSTTDSRHNHCEGKELAGYKELNAKQLTDSLFDQAVLNKETGEVKGNKDVVVTLVTGWNSNARVVIQTVQTQNDLFKKNVEGVMERFLSARTSWLALPESRRKGVRSTDRKRYG
jgi:hypothetical protein